MRELNDNYQLDTRNCNHWNLGGTIVFQNVANLEKKSKALRRKLNNKSPWFIDLMHIKKIDSAGLSWLLVNLRYAKTQKIDLKYENITNLDMKKLMNVQGLDKLIK